MYSTVRVALKSSDFLFLEIYVGDNHFNEVTERDVLHIWIC